MWWGLKSHLEKRMLAAPFSVGRLYQGFWLHSLLCWAGSSSYIWLTFLMASCLFFLSPFTQAVWGKIWTYTPCVWRMTQDKETASKWSLERQETEHTGKRATHGGKRPERKKKTSTNNKQPPDCFPIQHVRFLWIPKCESEVIPAICEKHTDKQIWKHLLGTEWPLVPRYNRNWWRFPVIFKDPL